MTENTSNDSIPESIHALGNVGTPTPVQFYQLPSDVPTGTKTEPTPSFIKLTQKETTKSIKKTTTYATFSYNVPLDNQLVSVAAIAKVIKTAAETYDRQHQDSFFQAWPDLIIRSNDETEEFTTAYLRTHIKKFARRVANYYVQYINHRKYWAASLMNIAILAKLQGEGPMKLFSERCKWGYVNSATNLYSKFPDPIGYVEAMAGLMRHAVGKTNYGSEILAIPMINVDIFGNRGYHSLPIDNLIATAGEDNTEGSSLRIDGDDGHGEVQAAKLLLIHLSSTLMEYTRFDTTTIHAQKKSRNWAPYMPRHENGPRLNVVEYDSNGDPEFTQSFQMNIDNLKSMLDNVDSDCPWASIAWNNYAYWEKLTTENFPEMQDVNSDLRVFAMTQLHILEEPKKAMDVYNTIYYSKNISMDEVIKAMQLKKDNKVNTATIVRWSPLVGGTDGTARSDGKFANNFERYDVFNSNVSEMLKDAKCWPDLTPTTFATATAEVNTSNGKPLNPIVINSVPTIGNELQPKAGVGNRQETSGAAIYGKYSTYLDMASSVSLDPTATNIIAHGVQSEWMKNFVKGGNGVVFEEDPTMVRILANPVLETNDEFMAGFSLLVFDKSLDTAPSDTSKFYQNEDNFEGVGDAPDAGPDSIESFIDINGTPTRMHTAVPSYLSLIKCAQIFLGEGIYCHPLINPSLRGSGNYTYMTYVGSNGDEPDYKNTAIFDMLNLESEDNFIKILSVSLAAGSDINKDTPYSGGITFTPNKPKSFFLMHFDPNYGPVKPVTYQNQIADIVPLDIYAYGDNETPTNDKVTVKFNKEYFAATPDLNNKSIDLPLLYSSSRSPAKCILPFITSFNLMPCYVDSYGAAHLVSDLPAGDNWFSTSWDYLNSLLTKTVTQFTGMEDTFPFWSHPMVVKIGTSCNIPSFGEINAVPKQDVQVAPRQPFSKALPRKPGFGDFKQKVTPMRSEGETAAKLLGGSISGKPEGRSSKGGKRHGRRHPRAADNRKIDQELTGMGVAGESSFANPPSSTISLVDDSTKKQDYDFNKKSKSIPDRNALGQMQG